MAISSAVRELFRKNYGYNPNTLAACSCASLNYDARNEVIHDGRTRGEIDDENLALIDVLSRPILIRKK